MAFEQKDNSGALFKNDRRTAETHPHAQGTCMIAGVEYYISAWTKQGTSGKYQSLSFKSKEQAKAALVKPARPLDEDDLSDVPF